jgi:quercetin dioxygenase-like cupin family protein
MRVQRRGRGSKRLARSKLTSWKKAAKKPQFLRWADIKEEKLNEKITRKLAVGQNEMVGRLRLAKGAVVPPHKHVSEQITMVLSGALRFTIGGEEIMVRTGEVLIIPPNVVHSAVALEDSDDIDSFSPLREDWLSGDDAYLKTGKSMLEK